MSRESFERFEIRDSYSGRGLAPKLREIEESSLSERGISALSAPAALQLRVWRPGIDELPEGEVRFDLL